PGMSFKEVVRAIDGEDPRPMDHRPPTAPPAPRPARGADRPAGWQGFVRGLVEKSESLLWSDEGKEGRDYLRGRALTDETIWGARLGYSLADEPVNGIFPDKALFVPEGVVIPWFDGDQVAAVNVRRLEIRDGERKYHQLRGSARAGLPYPGRH